MTRGQVRPRRPRKEPLPHDPHPHAPSGTTSRHARRRPRARRGSALRRRDRHRGPGGPGRRRRDRRRPRVRRGRRHGRGDRRRDRRGRPVRLRPLGRVRRRPRRVRGRQRRDAGRRLLRRHGRRRGHGRRRVHPARHVAGPGGRRHARDPHLHGRRRGRGAVRRPRRDARRHRRGDAHARGRGLRDHDDHRRRGAHRGADRDHAADRRRHDRAGRRRDDVRPDVDRDVGYRRGHRRRRAARLDRRERRRNRRRRAPRGRDRRRHPRRAPTGGGVAMSTQPAPTAPGTTHHPRKDRPVTLTHRRAAGGVAALTLTGLAVGLAAAPTAVGAPEAPTASAFLAPYYTALDLTGDQQVTTDDLAVVAEGLGLTADDEGWKDVALADTDGDGVLTVADLAAVSQRIVYDDGPFELVEASVVDMQAAMNAGVTTSVEIKQEYMDRIADYDRTVVDTGAGGRPLASIITTSDVALDAAKQADAVRAEQGMTSMLLGVPVAVKDNYDTKDMPTTGGCGCWDDNQTSTDAAMVGGLRADGAVLLAKASLDEFAFGFESQFSSYQAAGSATFVASPYATSRTAGGSSGGTGAAISANLAGIGFGTDTGGSIRVPSSYNQLVGVRPTVGLASRDGIIPLALDAVVGVDPADPVTSRQEGEVPASYTQYLDADALDGARIGYVPSMIGTNRTTTRLWAETRATLESLGATVVEVTPPTSYSTVLPNGFASVLSEGSGSTNEFKHDLDEYVANQLAPEVEARTLSGIVDSGRYVPARRSTYVSRGAITEATYQAWAGLGVTHTKVLAEGKTRVTQMLDGADLDALVYPSGNPYGTIGTNLRLSPNTGLPAVSVPMGQATAADATITGAGVNLELLGRDFAEGPLLGLAFALEQATQARTSPALYGPLG